MAAKQGFFPDMTGSDLHKENILGPAYDLTTVMTKMLHVGMPLHDVIKAVTWTPAQAIHRENLIGSLRVGREADITVLGLDKVDVDLEDSHGQLRRIKQRVVPVRVWRAGMEYPISELPVWPNRSQWDALANTTALDRLVVSDKMQNKSE